MLPLVETMNKNLIPKIKELSDKFTAKGGWGEKLEVFAATIGEWVSSIAGLMLEWPRATAGIYLLAKTLPTIGKIFGFLWERAKWFTNGIQLGLGFNSVAGGGGSGGSNIADSITDSLGKKVFGQKFGGAAAKTGKGMMGNFKGGLKSFGGIGAGILSGGLAAWDEYSENADKGMSTGENVGRTTAKGAGAGLGAWGGAAAGAAIGSAVPIIGTVIGGLIGAALGAWGGGALGEAGGDAIYGDEERGMNDGIFTSPLHDGYLSGLGSLGGAAMGGLLGGPLGMLAGGMFGSDFSKGRGVLQGGKITPIDNKDDLIAMKPGGAIEKAGAKGGVSVVKHTFETINLHGEIKLTSPGNPGKAVDLMKDPQFIRDITRTIQSQLEKNINGGKNKG
jgi:hypothetical protein